MDDDREMEGRLAGCIARVERMIRGVRAAVRDLQDDPNRHLKACACGRAETRHGQCSFCVAEMKPRMDTNDHES